VYVDDRDIIWLSEWMSNSILRFDPATESFVTFPSDKPLAQVLQMAGTHGKVWGGEQGAGRLVRIEPK
jgi:virginiamycin B lyase